jgi:DNA-directed RNA polymerase subunit RPC12/RpoP
MAEPQTSTPTPPTTDGQNRFPCKQCGAKLQFAPGTFVTVCPYCNCQNAIGAPTDTKLVREIDYLTTLRQLKDRAPTSDVMTVKCDACAATIQAPPNVTSLSCPFCGSNIVSTAKAATQIKPGALLPFRATRDEAVARFKSWLGTLWFAPSKLRHNGMLDSCFTGTYLPAWTYDSQTTTWYEGERGDAYWESQTIYVNGRAQMRMVRKIRWTSVSGTVPVPFDDVLVIASKSLPAREVEKLEPWDLPACVPYADDYLAGFRAECYQVGLEEGFGVAKQKMQPTIENAIRADIGGDEQRIADTRTRYDAITYKHILLPVWLSAYRFNAKLYRFMVNARTGEVVGERPYSPVKITLFVLMCLAILGIIALVASHAR